MVSFIQDLRYLSWLENKLSVRFDPKSAIWLTSLSPSGSIRGVVVFSRFVDDRTCELTVASDDKAGFISREFAFAVAYYVWITCKFERVTAIIAVDNSKSLHLAQRLGFQEEGTLRKWFRGGKDAKILGLLREDCKWLRMLNGQWKPPAST